MKQEYIMLNSKLAAWKWIALVSTAHSKCSIAVREITSQGSIYWGGGGGGGGGSLRSNTSASPQTD